jgi:protease II
MYDKDKDSFTLMVRDLVTGTLCDKPRADRVSNISWAMDGKALVYVVTNEERRPYRLVIFFFFFLRTAHLCFILLQ